MTDELKITEEQYLEATKAPTGGRFKPTNVTTAYGRTWCRGCETSITVHGEQGQCPPGKSNSRRNVYGPDNPVVAWLMKRGAVKELHAPARTYEAELPRMFDDVDDEFDEEDAWAEYG